MNIETSHTHCSRCKCKVLVSIAARYGGKCGICHIDSKNILGLVSREPWFPENSHAAKSLEELDFLRNMLRDMHKIEPKKKYADWLAKNGELSKSEYLRKLIDAFQSLSFNALPDSKFVDKCWSRMVGGDTLLMLVEHTQELDLSQRLHLRNVVFKYLEPSIVIRYPSEKDSYLDFLPKPCSSHYFGDPDLSDDVVWPNYSDCLHDFEDTDGVIPLDSPCLFACQIRTQELALFLAGNMFADDELLSFFTNVEVNSLGSQSIYVLPQRNVSRLVPRQQPKGVSEENAKISARPIFFLEELSLPHSSELEFTEILGLEGLGYEGFRLYQALSGAGAVKGERGWTDLQMFGYLPASNGGALSKTTSHRLLASVRCSLDAGIVTLGIDGDSLKSRNWRKAEITCIDWDG